jgi:two-component system nitrate/nitrite response regulator NarL
VRDSQLDVSHCGSLTEALAHVNAHPVDIVVIGYDRGDNQELELIAQLNELRFPGRIIVLASAIDPQIATQLSVSSVAGVILKADTVEALAENLHKVDGGQTSFDPSYLAALGGAEESRPRFSLKLTERERVTLAALLQGLSNKEIATRLQISESGVKSVVQRLFRKTGAKTRSQLVRIALEKQ